MTTTIFEQIDTLKDEAEALQAEADGHMEAGRKALEQRNAKLAELRDLANEAAGSFEVGHNSSNNGSATTAPASTGARTAKKKTAAASVKTRRGRGGSTKKTSSKGRVAPSERNYGQEMSLREAVWDVLDRPKNKWPKIDGVDAKGEDGLRIIEVVKIIEHEQKWVSSAENIDRQVQNTVYDFKKEGKFARVAGNDGKTRYYVVNGATIDGPALDEDGKPIK